MQKKQYVIIPNKMVRDVAVSRFPSDAAYTLRNIRIVTNDSNDTFALTNEQGNSSTGIELGKVRMIGAASIVELAAIFYIEDGIFTIGILKEVDNNLTIKKYKIPSIDNSDSIKSVDVVITKEIASSKEGTYDKFKIYWTDGINQPQVFQYTDSDETPDPNISNNSDTSFNPPLEATFGALDESYNKVQTSGTGLLPAGVFQYAVILYNRNGQSSPPVYISPLVYSSYEDSGLSPEDKSFNTFKFEVSLPLNVPYTSYSAYRIARTSINATASVDLIYSGDIEKSDSESIKLIITDTGKSLGTYSLDELLQSQSEPFSAETLCTKDGVLFLGNITLIVPSIDYIKEEIKEGATVNFINQEVDLTDEDSSLNTQYIHYNNLAKTNRDITFFKCGDTYRIGIQFLHKSGAWSNTVHLGDKKCNLRVVPKLLDEGIKSKPALQVTLNPDLVTKLKSLDYIGARLLCVYPDIADRSVICQGIVIPTLYNMQDRVDGSIYAQSSWFARASYCDDEKYNSYTRLGYNTAGSVYPSPFVERARNSQGQPLEYRMINSDGFLTLPDSNLFNSEVQYSVEVPSSFFNVDKALLTSQRSALVEDKFCTFGVDRRIVTFHSPELDTAFTTDYVSLGSTGYKFRIVGYVPVKNVQSEYFLQVKNPFSPELGKDWHNILQNNSYKRGEGDYIISGLSLNTHTFWFDGVAFDDTPYPEREHNDGGYYRFASFPIYPWHRKGSLNNQGAISDEINKKSVLQHKRLSNLRVCLPTRYLSEGDWWTAPAISNFEVFNSDQVVLTKLNVWGKSINYYGNVDRVFAVDANNATKFPVKMYSRVFSNYYSEINYGGLIYDINNLVKGIDTQLGIDNFGVYYSTVDVNNGYFDSHGIYASCSISQENQTIQSPNIYSVDPLPITYRSTSHGVFALEKDTDGMYVMLPRIQFPAGNNTRTTPVNEVMEDTLTVTLNINSTNSRLYAKVSEFIITEDLIYVPHLQIAAEGGTTQFQEKDGIYFSVSVEGKNYSQLNYRSALSDEYLGDDIRLIYYTDTTFAKRYQVYGYEADKFGDLNRYNFIKSLGVSVYSGRGHILGKDNLGNLKEGTSDEVRVLQYRVDNTGTVAPNADYLMSVIDQNSPVENNPGYYEMLKGNIGIGAICVRYLWLYDNDSKHAAAYEAYGAPWILADGDPIVATTMESRNLIISSDNKVEGINVPLRKVLEVDLSDEEGDIIVPDIPSYKDSMSNPDPNSNLIWDSPNEEYVGIKGGVIYANDYIPVKEDGFYYLLGEIYRDNQENLFGGNSEEVLASNTWIPCGSISYFTTDTETVLLGDEGDTYYMRYDHMKTLPLTQDDVNSIVDIVSFCCETHINLDGRYDRNRGNRDNLYVTEQNFNLFNPVYSQTNNAFTYNYIREDISKNRVFPNQFTYSQPKVVNSDIDPWTNVSLATIADCPLELGAIRAIRALNNDIYSFQDRGISRVLFNVRTQINSADGVPIEIGNNNKLEGVYTLTDAHGCDTYNKIVRTEKGLYFVDNISKELFRLGSSLENLSTANNMRSYFTNSDIEFLNYDPLLKDVYSVTSLEAVNFNENLESFMSFYDYGNVSHLMYVGSSVYQYSRADNSIWKIHSSDQYNTYFGIPMSWNIELIANPEFTSEKVFDTIEFRADDITSFNKVNGTMESISPFSSLKASNEYQKSETGINTLKKKFRIWRWSLGRSGRDRIENPWVKISITGNKDYTSKFSMYDTVVTYYV